MLASCGMRAAWSAWRLAVARGVRCVAIAAPKGTNRQSNTNVPHLVTNLESPHSICRLSPQSTRVRSGGKAVRGCVLVLGTSCTLAYWQSDRW